MVHSLSHFLLPFVILLFQSRSLFAQDAEALFDPEEETLAIMPPPMDLSQEIDTGFPEIREEEDFYGPLSTGIFGNDEQDWARDIPDPDKQTGDPLVLKQGHPLERQSSNVIPCGTRRLSRGFYYLQSPNYPKNYTNSYACSSRLYAPSRGSLSLTCDRNHFNIESSSRCANDYLQIYSSKYCGTRPPPNREGSSYLLTNFRTNSAVTSSGFRCLVEAREAGAGSPGLSCGSRRLRPGTYTFSSHNYPRNYDNYRYCYWLFVGYNRADKVSISCSRFSLESSSSCQYDYLYVNGRRYCGTSGPVNVTRTYYSYARFSSDFSVTSTGFTCTVTVAPACRCGIKSSSTRVVGGRNTTSAEYPWMAGLVSRGGTRTFCGGSLINNLYVLTAAHCVSRRTTSNLEVLLGDHLIGVSDGESRHSLSRIIPHCNYFNYRDGWDFALLRLSAPVTFTSRRLPVCLPTAGRDYAGITAIATGWGRLGATRPQANILQEVELPVISNTQCRARWSFIHYSHICAGGLPQGGKSVCNGDSGGPLIAFENNHYVVIGAVSFGRPCAHRNYPDGYGRVTEVLGWIRGNTRDATYCT